MTGDDEARLPYEKEAEEWLKAHPLPELTPAKEAMLVRLLHKLK